MTQNKNLGLPDLSGLLSISPIYLSVVPHRTPAVRAHGTRRGALVSADQWAGRDWNWEGPSGDAPYRVTTGVAKILPDGTVHYIALCEAGNHKTTNLRL